MTLPIVQRLRDAAAAIQDERVSMVATTGLLLMAWVCGASSKPCWWRRY
jgi:hypothetical protein